MPSLMVWTSEGLVRLGGAPALPPDLEPSPPPAVIILSSSSPSPTELLVSWLAPTWTGGTVARYEVDLDGESHDWDVHATSITIGGLDPDTEYTVAVRAVSGDALTGPATTITATTQQVVPTSSFAAVWDDMIASHSWETVQETFDLYTGYQAAGYSYADLVNVGGMITSSYDGQVIEGRRGTAMRISHNNVTVRGCLVVGGGTYGFDTNPRYGFTGTGIVVEHCTFDGGDPAVDKAGIMMSAANLAVTFRYCELRGWSSGVLGLNGVAVEYCWLTAFYRSSVSGAHVSSLNARGMNVRFYRNFATEGGSPICSIYFDQQPCHNIDIRENLLSARLSTSGNTPSYLLFFKTGSYSAGATNIVVGGNYLGDMVGVDFQYGRTAQLGIVPWGSNGNVRTSNIDFLTGVPID